MQSMIAKSAAKNSIAITKVRDIDFIGVMNWRPEECAIGASSSVGSNQDTNAKAGAWQRHQKD